MTDPQVAILMLSMFIFLVLLGFPIAFTLIAMGVGFGYYAYFQADNLFNNQIFYLLNQNTYSVMENDVLVAIPLFLFMGYVVERANIVNRLFFSLQLATRHLPGSMAVAALATCAIFATASGIIGAVVTLMGLLAFPAMVKANYNRGFAAGVICAGGTLGILIPPSIMLIVYAAIAELSPLRLYAAAIIPGFLLAGFYMIYVVGYAFFKPSIAPTPVEEEIPPTKTIILQLHEPPILSSFNSLVSLILVANKIRGRPSRHPVLVRVFPTQRLEPQKSAIGRQSMHLLARQRQDLSVSPSTLFSAHGSSLCGSGADLDTVLPYPVR